MRKNALKSIALVVLIGICFAQIASLWLGDASSHPFLNENIIEQQVMLQPKAIWLSTGAPYRIDKNKKECKVLLTELMSFLASSISHAKVETSDITSYASLISKPGVLYEYGMGFTLEEIVGSKLEKYTNIDRIDKIFVEVSAYNENIVTIYFISESDQMMQKLIIHGTLALHDKIVESFIENDLFKQVTEYQPSITSEKQQFIKQNVFFPLTNKEMPLYYGILQVFNPIEQAQDKMIALEDYVNSFFVNPLIKTVEPKQDGSIVFSENLKAVVKYRPVGTLEFNLPTSSEQIDCTSSEMIQKVLRFIEGCSGIPAYLREGVYLKNIAIKGDEYTYEFGCKYNGLDLQLTSLMKNQLGLNELLEITVKNNRIIKGKWSILQIKPKINKEPIAGSIVNGYGEVIDKMYTKYGLDSEKDVLDTIECAYVIDTLNGEIGAHWVATYKGRAYYPLGISKE